MDAKHSTSLLKRQCPFLRNKEMYYGESGLEDEAFSSGAFWCTKTQEAFGPDGEPAGGEECRAGRSCFPG